MFKHFHASILSLSYPRPSSWSFSIFLYLLESLMIINLQFSCNKFGLAQFFSATYQIQSNNTILNISHRLFWNLQHMRYINKTWPQALKSHYINNVNQSTCYLIDTSLPGMHIPFFALSFSLDVLHPSTSSANSTSSTNPSHPTQGWYQPFVYLLCAIQGACHYSSFNPPNTRTIPCTPLSGISLGCFTKLRHSVLAHLHSA